MYRFEKVWILLFDQKAVVPITNGGFGKGQMPSHNNEEDDPE
jgi:hypothetical protein